MVYMSFNSSCAYAGVANMLAQYHLDVDDRTIAMGMKLPYLFSCEDGIYMTGPMLQSADWFNLYLHSIGFHMVETAVPAEQAADFLKHQKTAMLGVELTQGGKHAIVYIGSRNGKLQFLNNKWEEDPAPDEILLTEAELRKQIEPTVMIATLEQITPEKMDLCGKLKDSVSVIRQNLSAIQETCRKEVTVGAVRQRLNSLFRPLLLDSITMLGLLGETELAQRFVAMQRSFLSSLRQDADTVLISGDYLSMQELSAAAECYMELIVKEADRLCACG